MVAKSVLLSVCTVIALSAQPLLSVEVYETVLGTKLDEAAGLRLVLTMAGKDYSENLRGHQGLVPEGSYRLMVSANSFMSHEETIRVTAPVTVVRVGLSLAHLTDRPTTELISGYVDSELSKDRDLWVQAYPVFRPQDPGRVTPIRKDGHFEISVPADMGAWMLVVIEMYVGPLEDLPRTERFPFPKVVGCRVVHTPEMPVKVAWNRAKGSLHVRPPPLQESFTIGMPRLCRPTGGSACRYLLLTPTFQRQSTCR